MKWAAPKPAGPVFSLGSAESTVLLLPVRPAPDGGDGGLRRACRLGLGAFGLGGFGLDGFGLDGFGLDGFGLRGGVFSLISNTGKGASVPSALPPMPPMLMHACQPGSSV